MSQKPARTYKFINRPTLGSDRSASVNTSQHIIPTKTNKTETLINNKQLHSVQQKLDRKQDLIDKYQNQIDQLLTHINAREPETVPPKTLLDKRTRQAKPARREESKSALLGLGADTVQFQDYRKIILNLQYSLEQQKKTAGDLERRNKSLQSQLSNLRNLVTRPQDATSNSDANEQNRTNQSGNVGAYRNIIAKLEQTIQDQKERRQHLLAAKQEIIIALEKENRLLKSEFDNELDKGLLKKIHQLTSLTEELRSALFKKNLKIQKLMYTGDEASVSSAESNASQIRKTKNTKHLAARIEELTKQLELSDKLILRKNTDLLQMARLKRTNQQVVLIIDNLLDKKEVAPSELLTHPVVNKTRMYLREKVLFEKELIEKLTLHNKKIQMLEEDLRNKSRVQDSQSSQLQLQNKQLTKAVNSLQRQVASLHTQLEDKKRQLEIMRNDFTIQKKNFVFKMKEMGYELNGVVDTTKEEFERLKLENLKLVEQNRSLLILVGAKEKELIQKGDAIRTFEKYKQGINNIDLSESPARKKTAGVPNEPVVSIAAPTRILTIQHFSDWLVEWNSVINWNNRKVLQNVFLDKQSIIEEAAESLKNVITVIHECLFNSKNVEVQQRAIVMLSHFLAFDILKNQGLLLSRVAPYAIRCYRGRNEGEDEQQHSIYNLSALKFTNQLYEDTQPWTYEMTNQMVAVNGFRYLFALINEDTAEDKVIEMAYNTLSLVARKGEMVSFMVSYRVTDMILSNIKSDYRFLPHLLYLLEGLLSSEEYKAAALKQLPQFRILFDLLKDDDADVIDTALGCLNLLCSDHGFVLGVNKREALPKLVHIFDVIDQFEPQKKAGTLFKILLEQVDPSDYTRTANNELTTLSQLLQKSRPVQIRFNRIVRVLLESLKIISSNVSLDEKVFTSQTKFMDQNFDAVETKTREKMIETVNLLIQRNKQLLETKTSGGGGFLQAMVKGYVANNNAWTTENIFYLTILKSFHDFKRTADVLKTGRETMVCKLVEQASVVDYTTNILSLKNLLSISKERYCEKFVTPKNIGSLLSLLKRQTQDEEYLSYCLSVLYFFSKIQGFSTVLIEGNVVGLVCEFMIARNEQSLVFKALALLESVHTLNIKKQVLNHFITKKLNSLKALNQHLHRSKNKPQLGSRSLFIYDFLNNSAQVQALTVAVQQNLWMVEDLIKVRNEFVKVLEPLVYKIELMLHEMAKRNKAIKKQYQKFMVQGGDEEDQ